MLTLTCDFLDESETGFQPLDENSSDNVAMFVPPKRDMWALVGRMVSDRYFPLGDDEQVQNWLALKAFKRLTPRAAPSGVLQPTARFRASSNLVRIVREGFIMASKMKPWAIKGTFDDELANLSDSCISDFIFLKLNRLIATLAERHASDGVRELLISDQHEFVAEFDSWVQSRLPLPPKLFPAFSNLLFAEMRDFLINGGFIGASWGSVKYQPHGLVLSVTRSC